MTEEEEKLYDVLSKKKHAEWLEAERAKGAAARDARRLAEIDRQEFDGAYYQARQANRSVHARFGTLKDVRITPSGFDPCAGKWDRSALDENALYLALVETNSADSDGNDENSGTRWNLCAFKYYAFEERWYTSSAHGWAECAAETMLQIHQIELPRVPYRLIPFPKKPASVAKLEDDEQDEK